MYILTKRRGFNYTGVEEYYWSVIDQSVLNNDYRLKNRNYTNLDWWYFI